MRVQADAGVNQKNAVVDHANLHRVYAGVEHGTHGIAQVFGNAVRAAEIIEGSLRQHAKGAACLQRLAGHGVDGAVAAGRNQDAAAVAGLCGVALRQRFEFGRVFDHLQGKNAAGIGQHPFDRFLLQFGGFVAGTGVKEDEQGGIIGWRSSWVSHGAGDHRSGGLDVDVVWHDLLS